jgi:hypothetical protein
VLPAADFAGPYAAFMVDISSTASSLTFQAHRNRYNVVMDKGPCPRREVEIAQHVGEGRELLVAASRGLRATKMAVGAKRRAATKAADKSVTRLMFR